MKCPKCESVESSVVDSRQSSEGLQIRRRRKCEWCKHKFTTYEICEGVSTNQLSALEHCYTVITKMLNRFEKLYQQVSLNGEIKRCKKHPNRPAYLKDYCSYCYHKDQEKKVIYKKPKQSARAG